MKKPSCPDERTICHQFDRLCQMALKGEAIDYHRRMKYLNENEVSFSELSEMELNQMIHFDDYDAENSHFTVLGYDIEVKDMLIAEALQKLTEKKRNVILLSYFMDMSDTEIAKEMHLVRNTIYKHRVRSLEILRKIMEEQKDED
ncbi:MAG: sigma-70 family RNA polymerase sigma factor [Clostridiales bacterium]|nr:sigma-70 family RNA polymerase sigma factor [Clostridiales bacterium]